MCLKSDYFFKASDPKERLKEEQDGIVLSPQRRNFSTGCQVSKTSSSQMGGGGPSIYRQSSISDFKDRDDRDRWVDGFDLPVLSNIGVDFPAVGEGEEVGMVGGGGKVGEWELDGV